MEIWILVLNVNWCQNCTLISLFFRLTARCHFNQEAEARIAAAVLTVPPPFPVRSDGEHLLELRIAKGNAFVQLYLQQILCNRNNDLEFLWISTLNRADLLSQMSPMQIITPAWSTL